MPESAGRALADRVEELLNGTARVAVPVPEIAEQLDTSPASLAAQLREDTRFVLIQPAAFPDLAMLTEAERSAYSRALREAGVHGTPSVALRDFDTDRNGDVDLLLRDSVTRLLVRSPEPALVAAAERMRRVVTAVTRSRPDSAEKAPSTTPAPDRTAGRRVPPRRRRSPPAPPRYPGSRRE